MSLLGSRLKELRGEKTLYQVGKACNLIPNDVSRYEKGERTPTPAVLKRLAEYFETEYSELRQLYYEDTINTPEEEKALLAWAENHISLDWLAIVIEKLSDKDELLKKIRPKE